MSSAEYHRSPRGDLMLLKSPRWDLVGSLIIRSAVSIQNSQTNKISRPLEIAAQETTFHDTHARTGTHTHTPHHHQGNETLKVLPYFSSSSPPPARQETNIWVKSKAGISKTGTSRAKNKKKGKIISHPKKVHGMFPSKREKFRICQASVNQ